jgi:hypothetical protein
MPNMKKVMVKKPAVRRAPSTGVKTPMPKVTPKPATLTGPAAVKEIQRQVSPAGVKQAEIKQKLATKKKYPGLYKKFK